MQTDPTFSIQECIRKQVEREDLLAWALREDPEIPEAVMRVEIPSQVWRPAVQLAFGSGVFKLIHSMMP